MKRLFKLIIFFIFLLFFISLPSSFAEEKRIRVVDATVNSANVNLVRIGS